MTDSFLSRLKGPALLGLFISALPIVFTSVLSYYAVRYESVVQAFSTADWVWLTLLSMVTCIGLTPPTLLALLFGYFLGWWGLLPACLGNLGSIVFIYYLTHWFDHERLLHYLERYPKAHHVLDGIRERELAVIFFAKLSPVLPFGLANLSFALAGASLKNMLLGGVLGMLPRTILAVFTGREANAIRTLLENPNQENWMQYIVMGLVIVSAVGLWQIIHKIWVQKPKPKPQHPL